MTIIKNTDDHKAGNNTEVHKKYLYKMLITLMKEGGVMAQTIIRNYNNKQQRGNDERNGTNREVCR